MENGTEIKRGPTRVFKFSLVLILLIVFGRASVSLYMSQWEKRRVKAQVSVKREPSPVITVHVSGAVKIEGVYTLKTGAKLADAVAKAGGLEDYAEVESLNMAAPLEDGDRILVPPEKKKSRGKKESLPDGFVLNINTADEESLQAIPGIGPALAGRIVSLRKSRGPYRSVEEIKLVQGIGDYRLEQIRKYITVGGE